MDIFTNHHYHNDNFKIDTVTDLVLVTCSNVTLESTVPSHCLPT